jgi:putative tryptophan/tyrosine transport system substrate-binding protein
MIGRRDFITLLGGAGLLCAAKARRARAQQVAMPVVGYLHPDSPQQMVRLLTAFHRGLSETGYVEGRNVAFEYRWARNDSARLPELAADLVRRRVIVIATPGSTAATIAAKAATATIPIVFSIGGDPVQTGLVASLKRPGGNVTGVNSMNVELSAKRIGLLHELLQPSKRLAMLVNPKNATTQAQIKDAQAAAMTLGRQLDILIASTEGDIDKAFANLVELKASALVVGADNSLLNWTERIARLALQHALPTIFPFRRDAEAGGLISYGTDLAYAHGHAGTYVGRILKGENPAELPVLQPTKFELVINVKTAKALGLTVPDKLLVAADEVIE